MRLTDKDGLPLILYHFTNRDVQSFLPLTHFGTLKAAEDRMWAKHGAQVPEGARIYPVTLKLENPLLVGEGANDLLDPHYDSKENIYKFMTRADISRIYTEPRNMNREVLEKELALFPRPAFSDILKGKDADDRYLSDLRERVRWQRLIQCLESHGFDGMTYINHSEDKGSLSWICFRPEQIISTGEALTVTREQQATLERQSIKKDSWHSVWRSSPDNPHRGCITPFFNSLPVITPEIEAALDQRNVPKTPCRSASFLENLVTIFKTSHDVATYKLPDAFCASMRAPDLTEITSRMPQLQWRRSY